MRACIAVVVLGALCLAPTTSAQGPEPRIATGVQVGSTDLSGLTATEATARLVAEVRPRLRAPVELTVRGRRFVLTAKRLRLRFDEAATVRRALRARPTSGGTTTVRPVVRFRRASVRAFALRAKAVSARRPRNAAIRVTIRRIVGRKGIYGRAISANAVERSIRRRLVDPLASRALRPRTYRIRPRLRLLELRRIHRAILTVDRGGHRLRLFRRLRYDRSYPIAVGAAGFETPRGLRRVLSREVNPAWTAPNRPWAGSYAGRTVPGGAPDNPLKARFIGLGGGIGIHGTSESWSIGTNASHGCIRMHVPDVIELFPRVPLGSLVLIR